MAITRHLFLLFTLLLFTGLSINTYAGPSCGDGEITAPETCEPPDTSKCSDSLDNVGAGVCRAESCTCCGDGTKDAEEDCDDGNTNPNDACDTEGVNAGNGACTLTFCGDGTLQTLNGNNNPEVCDDGNDDPTDTCDTVGVNSTGDGACTPTFCGDGTVQAPNGNGENEQCEPTADNTDTCDDNCQNIEAETCEDEIKNQDETDVDCGGNTCDACANDDACLVDGDCTSNSCVDNVCTAQDVGDNIEIDGCDTGVSDPGGIQDGIDQCAADATNHGLFVRCVAIFTKVERVPQSDRKGIMKCAAHSSIDGPEAVPTVGDTTGTGGNDSGNTRSTVVTSPPVVSPPVVSAPVATSTTSRSRSTGRWNSRSSRSQGGDGSSTDSSGSSGDSNDSSGSSDDSSSRTSRSDSAATGSVSGRSHSAFTWRRLRQR